MNLIYFDESKFYPKVSPFFFLGGIIVAEARAPQLEKTLSQIQYNHFGTQSLTKQTEIHGLDVFHGKGNFKGQALASRIKLMTEVLAALASNNVSLRFIRVDVLAHRKKYPAPWSEYKLSLTLFSERCCDYLDKKNELGVVFGDYEQDQIARSVLDFSQSKSTGTTLIYPGRSLERLMDSVYFTHSHYSRFLQAADLACYLCQRYESGRNATKYHDTQLQSAWQDFKGKVDFFMQTWS